MMHEIIDQFMQKNFIFPRHEILSVWERRKFFFSLADMATEIGGSGGGGVRPFVRKLTFLFYNSVKPPGIEESRGVQT